MKLLSTWNIVIGAIKEADWSPHHIGKRYTVSNVPACKKHKGVLVVGTLKEHAIKICHYLYRAASRLPRPTAFGVGRTARSLVSKNHVLRAEELVHADSPRSSEIHAAWSRGSGWKPTYGSSFLVFLLDLVC
jgi:hypothetical protein